jgi:hypothetical protein
MTFSPDPHCSTDLNSRTIFDGGNPYNSSIRAEVTFDGYAGATYYDVDAIDNCRDNTGVKWLYPASGAGVHGGCDSFPCDGAYKKWDDIQTRVMDKNTI